MEGVAARWRRRPKQVVADGDVPTNLSVIQMAEREVDFFGSWNPGPAAKKRTEPDWRGIHPEFQRDADFEAEPGGRRLDAAPPRGAPRTRCAGSLLMWGRGWGTGLSVSAQRGRGSA